MKVLKHLAERLSLSVSVGLLALLMVAGSSSVASAQPPGDPCREAGTCPQPGASGLPETTSASPPGLGPVFEAVLSWTKWIAGAAGLGGIFVIAIMMMIGRRNRSQLAADGMSALPWIVGGFILIGISAALAEALLSAGASAPVEF